MGDDVLLDRYWRQQWLIGQYHEDNERLYDLFLGLKERLEVLLAERPLIQVN